MHSSTLSDAEKAEMLAVAADPAYREMNRIEAELAARCAGKTPEENLAGLFLWLKALSILQPRFVPDRSLPRCEIVRL